MNRQKKYTILVLITTLIFFINTTQTMGNIYPGTTLYSNNINLGFTTTINTTYLALGPNYAHIHPWNITIHNLKENMWLNISNMNTTFNKNNLKNTDLGKTMIRFNATYKGGNTIVFSIHDNVGVLQYDVYKDGVRVQENIKADDNGNINISVSGWSTHDIWMTFTGIVPDPPYNGSSSFDPGSIRCNLTWNRGNNSDQEVVVGKSSGYPSSPFDGTIWQNSTSLFYNFSVNQSQFFTVWSYNVTTNTYSITGLNIPWGALGISCFNESNPSQSIGFDLEISNQAGTVVYQKNDLVNTHYIDYEDIPTGENTHIIVSNSSYRSRDRIEDIEPNHFYNFSFYLPLKELPNDDDGGSGPPGENYTRIYRIRVVDDINNPVDNVYIVVKKYINTTGVYETIGSGYSNGYGEWDIWLLPSTSYKIFLSKDGFQSVVGDSFQTDPVFFGADYPIIFQMYYEETQPQPPVYGFEDIHFTGVLWFIPGNNTYALNISFVDDGGYTFSSNLLVTMWNYTTNMSSVVGFWSFGNVSSWDVTVWGIDRNASYFCNLTYNHTYLGTQHSSFVLEKQIYVPITNEEIEELFDWMGVIPFGTVNFLMWIIFIGVCYYADERDAGKIIIVVGVIFLFFGLYIGVHTPVFGLVTSVVAGGALPALFITMGILMEWKRSRRRVI